MPGIGIPELIIVLVIVLVIFGPKRLPGSGKSLGSGMREFKDSITGALEGRRRRRRGRAPGARAARRPSPTVPQPAPRGRAGHRAARGNPLATALRRPVPHDERLSLVEHLDELRSRLIICVLALVVCFGFTFWQNDAVLDIVNEPLEETQNLDGEKRSGDPLEQNARFQIRHGRGLRARRALLRLAARSTRAWPRARASPRASAARTPTPRRRPRRPSGPRGPPPRRPRRTGSDSRSPSASPSRSRRRSASRSTPRCCSRCR